MAYKLFNLILPPFCLVCERRLTKGILCSFCKPENLEIDATNICYRCGIQLGMSYQNQACWYCKDKECYTNQIRTIWDYTGNTKDIILKMKYKPSIKLTKLIATESKFYFDKLFKNISWDLSIPIPSSLRAKKKRGFNQCTLIAKEITKNHQCNLLSKALKHTGSQIPQVSLSTKLRKQNMKNAFLANSKLVKNKSILLVDDVLTTGATSQSAAKALLEAGAKKVDLFCLARSPAWHLN